MISDTWLCAWRELRRRKARAALTAGGYALAVAVMGATAASLELSRRSADEVLTSTGTHFIAFAPASANCVSCQVRPAPSPEEGLVANGVASALFGGDLIDRIRRLPTVKAASPYLLYRFRDAGGHGFTVGGFKLDNNAAVGTTCCAATDIIAGRFLNAADRGKVMAEEAYARLRGLKVGDRVEVAGKPFEVVGIVNPGIRPAKADLYMPFEEARQAISARLPPPPLGDEANVALVEVAGSAVQDEAILSVRGLLPGLVVSSYACYRPASAVMGMHAGAAWTVALLVAAGALLWAGKTQWSWVHERRREIGILKAIGWSDCVILRQVLAESLIQSVLGGAAGAAAAVALVAALGGPSPAAGSAMPSAGVVAIILAVAAALAVAGGLLAGLAPALAAARRRPAETLRQI